MLDVESQAACLETAGHR